MSSPQVLFGFHALGVRLKTAPQSIVEIYFESTPKSKINIVCLAAGLFFSRVFFNLAFFFILFPHSHSWAYLENFAFSLN